MSLILDALQQADTERGIGSAPDLFAPVPPTAHTAPEAAPARRRWAWPAIALLLAVALLWALWRLQAPLDRSTSRAAASLSAPQPSPEVTAATRPDPPPENTEALNAPARGALFRPAPTATDRDRPAPMAATPPPTVPLPTVSSVPMAPPAETGAPPIPSPQPVTPLADIAAAQRAGWPPLQITGHTYSDNPTLRMLMVDGHMVVEGQTIAPGLRLERIGRQQAIFNHRGNRFSVGY